MTDVFVLQNSNQDYLGRQGEWLAAGESASFYRTPHKDEAINQMVELTVRHPELRIRLIKCQLDEKGRPRIVEAHRPEDAPSDCEPPAPDILSG